MTYILSLLAPGNYDVLLNWKVVASLVRSGSISDPTWTAELLEDVHPRPAPLTELEHEFGSLEEAQEWLGVAEPVDADAQDKT